MIHRLVLCLACLISPCLTQAGAWPRDAGTAFISIGGAQLFPDGGGEEQETTVYAELGLKKNYTLGVSASLNMQSSGEGHVFLRFPPLDRPNGALIAFEAGYGAKSVDGITFHQFVKVGAAWSKGVTLRTKSGWASVETALFWDTDEGDNRLKLDATLGVSLSERFQLIGQAFGEATQYGESLTFAPSVVFRQKTGKTSYQLGIDSKHGQGAQTALRFSVWTEF